MYTDDMQGQERATDQNMEWEAESTLGLEGDDDDQSTQSLASSILDYTYENGRRYHAYRSGQYFMPNDQEEMQAMDLMHYICRMLLEGGLCRAPIKQPMNILDVGTGTGIWAIDMADKYASAYVIGTDLSPIQPSWVPPNLQFEVDDCESEWNFTQKFDLIHMRNLGGSIADWPQLLQRCYDHLTPGGWIEIANLDAFGKSHNDALPLDSATYEWQRNIAAAASQVGRHLGTAPQAAGLLKQAGFGDVAEDKYMLPASGWMPGQKEQRLAAYFQYLALSELEAMSLALFTRVLGWTTEQLRVLLGKMATEMKNKDYQIYGTMHFIYGQKPFK